MAQNGDALDRQARPERVDGLEVRSQPVEPAELALGLRDARVGVVESRSGGGDGVMTSQAWGARLAGSWEMR